MTADHHSDDSDTSAFTGGGLPGELSSPTPASPGGMDLGGLLASAQSAMAAQAEAASKTVEGTAGGGVVGVTMSGAGEVLKVSLAPEVVDPDEVEMLEDLIVAAVADAATKVAALQREALGAFGQMDLSGGLGGLGDLLGGSGQPGD